MRLLVVGEPRSGKSSWCGEYIDRRRRSGASVGGVLCPAIEQQGQRVGSNALDLLTSQEVPFARLSRYGSFKSGQRIGDYTISWDGIIFASAAIKRSVESGCDLVVIDEVGPLELDGKGLISAVELALASAVSVLIVVRSSLKEALQKRFPEYGFVVVADLTQSTSNITEAADGKNSGASAYDLRAQGRQARETD